MNTDIKYVLSITATLIAVVSYIPYLLDIWRGKTKPHAFSWFIWALLAFIAGAAQIADGAGIGSLVVITTGVISLGISIYSIKKSTVKITKSDWIMFLTALLAIPLWIITKRPLLSVILVSIIDGVGFLPTFRKSYSAPESETLITWYLSTIKHCITVAALERYTWVTVLYPASLAIQTGIFVIMLMIRKTKLR